MANRFYTVMIVPEKTDQVRKLLIPAWVLRGAAVAMAFVTLLGIVMVLGETIGEVITDPRLRARHVHSRNLRLRQVTQDLRF